MRSKVQSAIVALLVLSWSSALGSQSLAVGGEFSSEPARVHSTAESLIAEPLLSRPAYLTIEEASLYTALSELQRGSGVPLAFSPTLLPAAPKVSCQCDDLSVGEALDRMLEGIAFRYIQFGSQVLVEPHPTPRAVPSMSIPPKVMKVSFASNISPLEPLRHSSSASKPAFRRTGGIQGEVVDARTKRPIAGAQVHIPGTSLGMVTNHTGRFQLMNVPAGETVVRVLMIGYSTSDQTVSVAAGGVVRVDFQLTEQVLALDELVVTGTAGQARRREVGNTISQISVSKIDQPVQSVDALLQGRSTSMTVNPGSSTFGAGAQIRLRGNVSMSMSNQPIVFVDGVRLASDSYPLNRSDNGSFALSPQATMSPLNDINPNDIDRIEIVKGAAATTLYGSEAAGGVIQIFTKKGGQGQPTWTLQTDHGLDRVLKYGSKQRPYIGMDQFLKTAYGMKNSLSLSGGGTAARYFLSGGYDQGKGVHPNDEETRVSFRGNFDIHARDNLDIQWNSSYSNHNISITPVGNNAQGIQFNVYRAPNNSVASSEYKDIAQLLDGTMDQINSHFTTGVTANWIPFSRLTQRVTVGLDRMTSELDQLRPYGFVSEPRGSMSYVKWESQTLTFDYVGSLSTQPLEELRSTLSWGAQSVSTEETRLDGYGSGFPGPGEHTLSSTAIKTVSQDAFRVVNAGVFLQNLFDFRDRYFLTIGARVDGNSAFGEALGLQIYPKVSGSYVISDESFWNDGWGHMKLRGAYGHAGRAPGAFDAVRTWSPQAFGTETAFLPNNVGNPHLGPERTREVELGFDGAFLDGRLSLDFTFYDQVTDDALFNVTQIPTQGFLGGQLENVGQLTNRGLELTVNGELLHRESFAWDAGISFSTNKSRIVDIGSATDYSIQAGQPAPAVRGTLIRNAKEFADPIIELDHFFGANQPTRIIGLNSSLGLPHGLRLTARGEFQGGHYISDAASSAMVNRGNGAPACDDAYEHVPFNSYPTGQLDRVNALDRARCYSQNLQGNMWIYPADFFKIRELTLMAPISNLVPRASSATFTLSARNFYRWTNKNFPTFDPEMVGSRDGVRSLTSGIVEHTPAPSQLVASIRVVF